MLKEIQPIIHFRLNILDWPKAKIHFLSLTANDIDTTGIVMSVFLNI